MVSEKHFDFSKYISLTWNRPCRCACVLLLTACNQDQLRKQQSKIALLLTSVFTLLGTVSMRHMEIIDSSIPLRKRKHSVMLGYTRTHRLWFSLGGDGIASDVTVNATQSYWYVLLRPDLQMQQFTEVGKCLALSKKKKDLMVLSTHLANNSRIGQSIHTSKGRQAWTIPRKDLTYITYELERESWVYVAV